MLFRSLRLSHTQTPAPRVPYVPPHRQDILHAPPAALAKMAWPMPAPCPKAPPPIQGCQTVTTPDLVGSVLHRGLELGEQGGAQYQPGSTAPPSPVGPPYPQPHPPCFLQAGAHLMSALGLPVQSSHRDFCFEKCMQQVLSLAGERRKRERNTHTHAHTHTHTRSEERRVGKECLPV